MVVAVGEREERVVFDEWEAGELSVEYSQQEDDGGETDQDE